MLCVSVDVRCRLFFICVISDMLIDSLIFNLIVLLVVNGLSKEGNSVIG